MRGWWGPEKGGTHGGVRGACSAEGCSRLTRTGSSPWCEMHYYRLRRHGDHTVRKYDGAGFVTSHGYRAVWHKGRQEYEHRLVLLARIGPGEHPCHWCGRRLVWGVNLVTDHVDFDRANNDPGNLVPACHRCNSRRAVERRSA